MRLFVNNAQSMREACAGSYLTEAALQATAIAALFTAIVAKETFSTTISVSSKTAQDVQNLMRDLVLCGFTVSLGGSTLTISW